ncbi:MAG TPA: ArsC/Spx/MgsR family protein [Stellaceae bacterium]|nr:ArsC/Spx/MgsR family protein [Stellaceae bacterium]
MAVTIYHNPRCNTSRKTDPKKMSEEALIAAMAKHPIIVERPIVVSGRKAALGRPPEKALSVP